MADYRTYIRTSTAPFDGTTLETAVYSQERYVYTTTASGVVGAWSPAAIGRSNVCSLVKVTGQNAFNPGDIVEVKTASSALVQAADLTPQGTPFIFMMPDDILTVTTGDDTTIEILVNDLTDDQLIEYINGLVASGQSIPVVALPQANITITSTQNIPAYPTGELIVHVEANLDAILTLPSIASTELGDIIRIIYESGAGIPLIQTDANGTKVNGQIGVSNNEYYLRSLGDSITYIRIEGGWQRKFGEQAPPSLTSSANPINITTFKGGTFYVFDEGTDLGNVLQLQPLSDYKEGCKITVINRDTNAHVLAADAGETINGFAQINVAAGSTFTVEHAGDEWIAVGGDIVATRFQTVLALPATIESVSGQLTVNIDAPADGDITLPVLADISLGSQIRIIRGAGAGQPRIITDNNATRVNGLATIQGTEYFLRNIGDSITYTAVDSVIGPIWQRDTSDQVYTTVLNVALPYTIPPFKYGTAYIITNDNGTITLPSTAACNIGVRIVILSTGFDPVDVVPSGGATIAGNYALNVARYELTSLTPVIFEQISSTSWAVISNQSITSPKASGANIVLFPPETTGQKTFVQMIGGAGQTLTLPNFAQVAPGTEIRIFNNSGNNHTIIPFGADLINGANASYVDVSGKSLSIMSYGIDYTGPTLIGWVTLQGA